MKTKNIQDVVAEFDKKYVTHCSDGEILNGMVDAKKVKKWLTTTLTQLAKEVEAGERERLLGVVRKINVMNPEQVNDGFILGFANCRQRVEKALTPPTSDVTEK